MKGALFVPSVPSVTRERVGKGVAAAGVVASLCQGLAWVLADGRAPGQIQQTPD